MILVLFGQPHSGKSTLSNLIKANLKDSGITYNDIDGDRLRAIFHNTDYSKEGRINNLKTASNIAHYLSYEVDVVIVTLVYPYKEAREYLSNLNEDVLWVYLYYNPTELRGRENFHVLDFDVPENPNLSINTSEQSELGSALQIINLIKNYGK